MNFCVAKANAWEAFDEGTRRGIDAWEEFDEGTRRGIDAWEPQSDYKNIQLPISKPLPIEQAIYK